MRPREDRSRGLAPELFDGECRILPAAQQRFPLLDERSHERVQLVQRRPAPLHVLLEGEGKLRALLELPAEHDERAEDEAPEQRIEMGRAHGHRFPVRPRRRLSSLRP